MHLCIGGMTNATDDMYIGRSRQTHSAFGTPSLQVTCCMSAAWMCLWQPCSWNGAAECSAALTYIAGLYADKNTEYEVTTSWEAFWSSAEKHF